MSSAELITQKKTKNIIDTELICNSLSGDFNKDLLPTTGSTSTQHVHSFHKYKAKFFPRLVRSFIAQYYDILPKDNNGKIKLLDPFVGSGTALIESSLLGIESFGIDIDKLSCAITQAKIDSIDIDYNTLKDNAQKLINQYGKTGENSFTNAYVFPDAITKNSRDGVPMTRN